MSDNKNGGAKFLWTESAKLTDKKRITRPQIIKVREMPVDGVISGVVLGIVDGSETIKQKLLHMRGDASEFLFPMTVVILSELTSAFGDVQNAVGKKIYIKKIGEKDSMKYRGKTYNVFEIYVD